MRNPDEKPWLFPKQHTCLLTYLLTYLLTCLYCASVMKMMTTGPFVQLSFRIYFYTIFLICQIVQLITNLINVISLWVTDPDPTWVFFGFPVQTNPRAFPHIWAKFLLFSLWIYPCKIRSNCITCKFCRKPIQGDGQVLKQEPRIWIHCWGQPANESRNIKMRDFRNSFLTPDTQASSQEDMIGFFFLPLKTCTRVKYYLAIKD